MNGALIIDKPQEFTSFDVVAVVRKICKTKKVGHTGTLDPMATGVLPILIGNATRAADILPDSDKAYIATFKFGVTTDTQDITGKVLSQTEFSVSREKLSETCEKFRGRIKQIPPMYSAIKKNGVPLYDLARQGISVEREAREIFISRLELCDYNDQSGEGCIIVECSKGTYIRTLIADIGEELGCGAVMTSLRRSKACGFDITEAITLDELKKLAESGDIAQKLISAQRLFESLRSVKVTEKQQIRFCNGGSLDKERLPLPKKIANGTRLRVISADGKFLGIGEYKEEKNEVAMFKLFLD